jgi:hypothetical protein
LCQPLFGAYAPSNKTTFYFLDPLLNFSKPTIKLECFTSLLGFISLSPVANIYRDKINEITKKKKIQEVFFTLSSIFKFNQKEGKQCNVPFIHHQSQITVFLNTCQTFRFSQS